MHEMIHKLPDNLELLARQVVEGFIIGLHKSPFHGFSVEFAEHRLYNPGDVLRHIDWRVYGRTDRLFVKRFEEETNLRCCVAIDSSSSMYFPQDENKLNKFQYASLAAACLLQLLKRQLDASALAYFDSHLSYISECKSSGKHYRMLMATLEQHLKLKPEHRNTNAAAALHQIAERMHKRSLVVVLSDMMDDGAETEEIFAALQHLRYNKHEVVLFHIIEESKEAAFEFENRPYEFVDLENGAKIRLQPHQVQDQYKASMSQFLQSVANRCHQYQIDYTRIDLCQPVEQLLYSFLLKRNKLL